MDSQRIAAALCNVGRPMILQDASADSCIASTKIAMEVFEHFGYAPQAIGVKAVVANRMLAEVLDSGAATLTDETSWPPGAWCVAMGFGDEGRHVVCVVDDLMLDLSLDQSSRPAKGIELSASTFRIVPEFLGGEPMGFSHNGTAIVYSRTFNDGWWKKSPNWQNRDAPLRKKVVGAVIRAVKLPENNQGVSIDT